MKKRWFLILLGCLLFVSLVTTAWFRESEPRYKGKTAIEWAEIYESSFQPDGHNDLFARREAVDAVRHMRDQVLPLALNLISQEKPAWKDSVEHFMEFKLDVRRWCPTWVWLPFYRYPPNEGLVYFHMLGPDAGPAVPELVRVINESESLNISQRAMDALASIGAAGYPSLARIVADPSNPNRRYAVCTVGVMMDQHPDLSKIAIPLLVKCLNDSAPDVQFAATNALEEFAPDALASMQLPAADR